MIHGRGVALRDRYHGVGARTAQAGALRGRLALARSVLESPAGFDTEPEFLVPKWASDRDDAAVLAEWRGK